MILSTAELQTYMFCSEYSHQRKSRDWPLYDPRTEAQIAVSVILKWIGTYQMEHNNGFPTQMEILTQIIKLQNHFGSYGKTNPLAILSHIWGVVGLFNEERELTIANYGYILPVAGSQVRGSIFRLTKDSLWFYSPLGLRWLINSPDFWATILYLSSLPKKNTMFLGKREIRVLTFPSTELDPLDMKVSTISNKTLNFENMSRSLSLLVNNMRKDLHVPLLGCRLSSCPNYRTCFIGVK